MAPILRSQHRFSAADPCTDEDRTTHLSTQPQSPPGSPLAASISEHRNEFWHDTITIPLQKALMQLHNNRSLLRPRCLRSPSLPSLPGSTPAMSPTPESCALTISPRTPVSPPAHITLTSQEWADCPALGGKSLKRGSDESDNAISNVDHVWTKRRCVHAVGHMGSRGAKKAANEVSRKDEALFSRIEGDYAAWHRTEAEDNEHDAQSGNSNGICVRESEVSAAPPHPEPSDDWEDESAALKRGRKHVGSRTTVAPTRKRVKIAITIPSLSGQSMIVSQTLRPDALKQFLASVSEEDEDVARSDRVTHRPVAVTI